MSTATLDVARQQSKQQCPLSAGKEASSKAKASVDLSFLRIEEADRQRLRDFLPLLTDHLDTLLEKFYRFIETIPSMRGIIKNPAMEKHLKDAQAAHWQALFSAKFDEDYMERVGRIGKAHHVQKIEPDGFICSYLYILNEVLEIAIQNHYKTIRGVSEEDYSSAQAAKDLADQLQSIQKAVFLDIVMVVNTYYELIQKATRDKLVSFSEQRATELQKGTGAISGSMAKTNDAIQSVASSVEELSVTLNEIAGQTSESASKSEKTFELTQKGKERIESFQQLTKSIYNILNVLDDMAEQTNMLALNATISSQKAGSAGRGFQVIAEEIKRLAINSKDSTYKIGESINDIMNAMGELIGVMDAIHDGVSGMNTFNQTVSAAVEEQQTATNEISANMQNVSNASDDVVKNLSELDRTMDDFVTWVRNVEL